MGIWTVGMEVGPLVPIANGTLVSVKDFDGISFYGTGDDTFTFATAETYDGETTDLSTITDYWTNASTASADQWVHQTQAAGDSVTIASGMFVVYIDDADLPAGAEYVSCTHGSAGLVYAQPNAPLAGRDITLLRALSGSSS